MPALEDRYTTPSDLPDAIPVFPLPQAILLPRTTLPLNIFEPRYLAMVDAAMAGHRIIGMVQPSTKDGEETPRGPVLETVGGAGRITAYSEQPDGRYLITLTGLSRFRIVGELDAVTPFRQAEADFKAFADDLKPGFGQDDVDRSAVLKTLADYLKANDLTVDWDSIAGTENEVLVNSLAMMSPFGPIEKQALLEAESVAKRAEVLIALTEMALAQTAPNDDSRLQ